MVICSERQKNRRNATKGRERRKSVAVKRQRKDSKQHLSERQRQSDSCCVVTVNGGVSWTW